MPQTAQQSATSGSMLCYGDAMSEPAPVIDYPFESTKQTALVAHLDAFIDDLRTLADSAERLRDQPGLDLQHATLEAIRLAVNARHISRRSGDLLAALANADPNPTPVRQLARIMGVSRNTLSKRLPRSAPRTADDHNVF